MKFNFLNKSYIVMAGIVVAMLVLVIYMWIDAKKLERSLSPKTVQASKAGSAQTVTSPAQTGDTGYRRPESAQRKEATPPTNRTGRGVTNRRNSEDALSRRRSGTPPMTGPTDDWMFEKAEDLEEEQPVENAKAALPSE